MPSKKKVSIPTDSELLDLLYKYNPWWQNKEILTEEIQRSDFFKIKERLNDNEILAIIGPRRVGKTILLHQLIKEIRTNTLKENILFISIDNPAIQLTNSLIKIFDIYQTNILKIPFSDLKNKIYIFLDEIQSFKNWELELKSLYDLKYNIKFIVTGSSSVNIIEGASEALVGRIHPQIMLPIKFRDYIRFKNYRTSDLIDLTRISSKNMRNALKDALSNSKSIIFYNQIKTELNNLIPYKDRILTELNNYFLYGGYPQIIFNTDERKAKEYLEDYISLTLLKDIRKLFKIKKTDVLSILFYLLCKTSPHLINKTELCNVLKIDKNTLYTYIDALKTTFLISESSLFSNRPYNIVRTEQKKIYAIDIGIRNSSSNLLDSQIFADNMKIGDIAEIVIATHTNRLIYNLEGTKNNRIYYWRDSGQGPEVDIVITPFSTILPIEVKYQNSIGESDMTGLKKFNRKFNTSLSLMITKEELEYKDSIIKMPAWLYLIMC